MTGFAVVGPLCLALLLTATPARAEDPPPVSDPPVTAPADPGAPSADPSPEVAAEPAAPVVRDSRLPLRTGAVGWRVSKVQERLQWLGYEIFAGNVDNERMGESTAAAVKRFQGKFGLRTSGVVGNGTWRRLAEVSGKVGRLPKSCVGERTICIDKAQRLVRLVENGKVRLTLDARFGFVGAETHEGTFRVHFKSRDHTSSLYRTWMPFALFFSGGQAVHYSPYFARDGYSGASHGCVNLRDYDAARWLFDRTPLGTRVFVYHS